MISHRFAMCISYKDKMDRTHDKASETLASLFDAGKIAAPDWRTIDFALKQLSAYMDTGMEPEEIVAAENRRHDCNIECLLKKYNEVTEKLKAYQDTGYSPAEIADLAVGKATAETIVRQYEEWEKDGIVIRLPCKKEATVYVIQSLYKGRKKVGEEVEEAQIDRFIIGEAGIPVADICTEGGCWYEAMEPKDYYLTREEAEAALGGANRG